MTKTRTSGQSSKKRYKKVIIKDPWSRGTPSYIVPLTMVASTLAVNPKRKQQQKQSEGLSSGEGGRSSTEERAEEVKKEGVLIEGTGRYLTEIAVKTRDSVVFVVPPSALIDTRGYESYKRQAKRDFIRPFPLCNFYHTVLGGSGHCPLAQNCGGIHVSSEALASFEPVKQLTPCCWHHGDSLAAKSGLPVFVIDGHSWKIPVGRWARTAALSRARPQNTILRESDICLNHMKSKCNAGRSCEKYHICRVWTQKVGLFDTLLKERSDSSEAGGTSSAKGPRPASARVVWDTNKQPGGRSEGSDEGVSSEEKLLMEACMHAHTRSHAQKEIPASSTSPSDDSTGSNNGTEDQSSRPRSHHKHSDSQSQGILQEGSSRFDIGSGTVSGSTSGSAPRGSGTGSSEDFDPTKPVLLCRHYLEGSCKLDSQCKAAHVDPDFIEACRQEEVVVRSDDGKVFTVPYADILMTKGLEAYNRRCRASRFSPFPLCESVRDGTVCPHGTKCVAIHLDAKQYNNMREGVLRTPCCYHHGDSLSTNKCLVAGLVMDSHVWRFPTGRMARTAAPDRPDLWVDPSDLCIRHLWGRCKSGRACTKYHICREWLRKVRLINRLTQYSHAQRQGRTNPNHSSSNSREGDEAHSTSHSKTYTPSDSSDGNDPGVYKRHLRAFQSSDDVGNGDKNDCSEQKGSSSDDACPTLLSSDDASPPLLCSTDQSGSTPAGKFNSNSGSDSGDQPPAPKTYTPGFANQGETQGGQRGQGEGQVSLPPSQHIAPPRSKHTRKRKAHGSDAA